jgi:hypothetical protein
MGKIEFSKIHRQQLTLHLGPGRQNSGDNLHLMYSHRKKPANADEATKPPIAITANMAVNYLLRSK